MKTKALLVLVAGLMALAVSAQEFKCEDNFKALAASVKAQDYAAATVTLAGLRKSCAKYNVNQYILGEEVLKYNMETARAEADVNLYTTDLLAFYDEWEKNFPAKGGVQKKALLLKEKALVDDNEVFKLLDAAFTANKTSFTSYEALELYYNLYLARFQKGDKGITQDQFIQKFGDMAGQAAYAKAQVQQKRAELLTKKQTQQLEDEETAFLKDAGQAISAFGAVLDNMIIQSSKHVNCQKLEEYYNNLFEKNKGDKVWLTGLVRVLSNNCKTTPVLQKGAAELYKINPALDTALLLGNLALKSNVTEAVGYFEKAASFEADSVGKAAIYMTIAGSLRNSDRAAAKSYLIKAAEFNRKDGSPYIQLAEMYTTGFECKLSDFEKKAVFWLAIETVKKAEVANPKQKPTVAALIKRYEEKVPKKDDLKAAKKNKGDSVAFGCWINETITVPKVK